MRISYLLATLVALAASGACDNDPAKGKAVAKVAAPAVESAQIGSATAATKYVFSNAGSTIEFVGAKVTRKHDGAFHVFTGAVELVDGDPAKSIITAEIAIGSITADEPKLTAHLKSPDLLDVEKYPKARFRSTALRPGGGQGASYTVTGNFELHGVTKSITFPVTVKIAGETLDARAEFAIDRKDFGIVYPGMPDDLIKDDVLLKLKIHGMKMPRTP